MDEAIRKATVLIEALGWVRRFRGRYVVIKLGGSALEAPDAVRGVLTDVIFMETVGMKPVLIHGGGKAINRAMAEARLEPRFVHGRRYTDARTLEIVTRVLASEIGPSLVEEIERQGARAEVLSCLTRPCLFGERLTLTQGEETIDLGAVGRVVDVDRALIEDVCRAETIPVIPSVAVESADSGPQTPDSFLNVNADTAAAAVARLLGAEKLVFLSDVAGIFRDRRDPQTLLSHLEAARCRELIEQGVIDSGMVPKVDAALEALEAGVGKVHIVDGRMPHSMLLEIYSDRGVGTEIVRS